MSRVHSSRLVLAALLAGMVHLGCAAHQADDGRRLQGKGDAESAMAMAGDQAGSRQRGVVPLPASVRLPDGVRADDAWFAGVPAINGFRQVSPEEGAAPSRCTRLQMGHDAQALYIRVFACEPESDRIVARQMRRDAEEILNEDQVTVVIDPEGAGRNGYLFAVNANGARYDALVFDGGVTRADWDAIWQAHTRQVADGWIVDMRIPLSILGRRGSGSVSSWRINAERWMPRCNERIRLAGIRPDRDVYALGDAVPMPAVDTSAAGSNLSLRASLRASHASASVSGGERARQRLEPGLEVFHENAGGLRTAAAFNIDFDDADADKRTINLTGHELLVDEKRTFFLQDAGSFSFGGLIPDKQDKVMPYYSRRIGLGAQDQPLGLDAGLKLTGGLGGFDVGVLGARVASGQTAEGEPAQPAANMGVLRVARPVGGRHRVGMIATQGNPSGASGSHLWGADYQYLNTDWLSDEEGSGKTLEVYGWWLASRNADVGGDRAWGVRVDYPNVGLTGSASWQRFGTGFDPALGYLAEAGVTVSDGEVGWWHVDDTGASFIPKLVWALSRDLGGAQRSLALSPTFEYTHASGDVLTLSMTFEGERLAQAHEPLPDLEVAPGAYHWHYFSANVTTVASRALSVSGEFRLGGYYDGSRQDQTLTLTWKPQARWGMELSLERSAIHLAEERMNTHVAGLRFDLTPNTDLASSLLVQWDDQSHQVGASARLRWLWTVEREVTMSFDRLRYTGEERELNDDETRAMLKLTWRLGY